MDVFINVSNGGAKSSGSFFSCLLVILLRRCLAMGFWLVLGPCHRLLLVLAAGNPGSVVAEALGSSGDVNFNTQSGMDEYAG